MFIKCENCGIDVEKYPYEIKILKNIFCSKRCRVSYNCRQKKNWNFFIDINSEEKAYWLGFICADGWLCDRDSSIGIGLSPKDKNHLLKFSKIFNINICENENVVQIQLYNKIMFLDLINKGLHSRKSLNSLTKVFDFVPNEIMNHFVRGWFDGDGCINIRKHTSIGIFSIVGEKNNLHKIQEIMLNSIQGLKKTKISKKRNKNAYRLRWGGTDSIIRIKKWLYKNATIFLERKKEKFDEVEIKKRIGSSIYRGVSWSKTRNKWISMIQCNGQSYNLGGFDKEEQAAKAYNDALIKFGKSLNYWNKI